MSFNKKPIYQFEDKGQVGIMEVPDQRLVLVEDFDGRSYTFLKRNNTGVNQNTTIEEAYINNNLGEILKEEVVNLGSNSIIDIKEGCYFKKQLDSNITFTFTGTKDDGVSLEFILELNKGGNYAITWPNSVSWHNGVPPTLTLDGIDIVGFYSLDDGFTWRGMLMAKDIR
jgi:hypothetical protein